MKKLVMNTEIDVGQRFDFSLKIVARQVIREALREESCPFDCEISLVVTGDETIREYNRTFRGIDRETDVLSFPALCFDAPADFDSAAEVAADCIDPDNGCVVLGDIVVNACRVRSQAQEYGHSEKREFAFLVAHSMMHLFGYDHETPEEAERMEQRQEAVLASLGIRRGEAPAAPGC